MSSTGWFKHGQTWGAMGLSSTTRNRRKQQRSPGTNSQSLGDSGCILDRSGCVNAIGTLRALFHWVQHVEMIPRIRWEDLKITRVQGCPQVDLKRKGKSLHENYPAQVHPVALMVYKLFRSFFDRSFFKSGPNLPMKWLQTSSDALNHRNERTTVDRWCFYSKP